MPKRDCVAIDYKKIIVLIKKKYRSATVFCEALNEALGIERSTKLVSEWKRDRNFPPAKEAAVICLLLQTTPEEILLHSGPTEEETQKCLEDIEEVKRLIEEERGRNVKKETPGPKVEGFDRIQQFVGAASKEEIAELHQFIDFLESKRGKDETKS